MIIAALITSELSSFLNRVNERVRVALFRRRRRHLVALVVVVVVVVLGYISSHLRARVRQTHTRARAIAR